MSFRSWFDCLSLFFFACRFLVFLSMALSGSSRALVLSWAGAGAVGGATDTVILGAGLLCLPVTSRLGVGLLERFLPPGLLEIGSLPPGMSGRCSLLSGYSPDFLLSGYSPSFLLLFGISSSSLSSISGQNNWGQLGDRQTAPRAIRERGSRE